MAEVKRMADMPRNVVVDVFRRLNKGKVAAKGFFRGKFYDESSEPVIVTDAEPKDLVYPEGWYYAKGHLRNKHNTTNGMYTEILMVKTSGELWLETAKYSTR